MRRINTRNSMSIGGRHPNGRDFQRQQKLKPAQCQRKSVSGRMIVKACRIDGNHTDPMQARGRKVLSGRY
jgi:hypothetical protein